MLATPVAAIQEAIYPVSFYRVKARTIHAICGQILSQYGGDVPSNMEDLLELPGVGHCPQLDVPAETAELILEFVSVSSSADTATRTAE